MKPSGWISIVSGPVFLLILATMSPAASKKAFLSFPLDVLCTGSPCTPFTVKVSAIQDHSVPTGYNCNKVGTCDGIVQAYNGEKGDREKNCSPPGYKNTNGTPFLAGVLNYVGAKCRPEDSEAFRFPERFLNYDGHAGYDFPYPLGTTIRAPADGTLFQATTDPINGTNGKDTAWRGFHTFYVDHGNGYTTWYLHSLTFSDTVWAVIKKMGSATVKRGEEIAFVGKHGAGSSHLHFEVRRGREEVIDPYAEGLWKGKTIAPGNNDIGVEAVWDPPQVVWGRLQEGCRRAEGEKKYIECVLSIMQEAGASSQVMAFTQLIGGDGFMASFREMGTVDLAIAFIPFRANDNESTFLVNGTPRILDIQFSRKLEKIDISKDPFYPSLVAKFPRLMLWGHPEFESVQNLSTGGQRFIFRFDLVNGCHACELGGHAHIAYDFDKQGKFLRRRLLSLSEADSSS